MTREFKRRDFIKFMGAGAAATLAGCATETTAPKPAGRVIVIGGGFGGATVAKYIRMWSGGTIQVFMIEREQKFVSCPLSNLVLAGSRSIEQNTIGYEKLRNYGVTVLNGEVAAVDPQKRLVRFKEKYGDLSYDRLVIAPGIDFMYDQLPGLNNADAQKQVLHAWKAGEQTVALRKQLEAMPDGGVFVFSFPKMPYRCPPGPYERVCQVADYFKRAKPRSKVLVLDANPDIVSKKGLFLAAWNDLYKGIIEYRPNQEAKDVDVRSRTVKTEFDSFKGDVLNVVPPQKAGTIAAAAGVVTANNRWCEINWLTMESIKVPNVHVIGDATQSAPGMPKSGSMANQHAKIAASAIVALMTGQPVNQTPMINNTCYSYTSATDAMHVTSIHQWDPAQKTLVPVKGAGGVPPARSALEKQFADGWAVNIWSDMLG